MTKDKGGWRSVGMEVSCPRCGEMGPMIETTIYGRTHRQHFCNCCAAGWVTHERDDEDEHDSER